MKIVEMKGRLGNQMFIYAFAKALEHNTGEKVYFDDTFYLKHSSNTIELENIFNVKMSYATNEDLKKYQFAKKHKKISPLTPFLAKILKERGDNKFSKELFDYSGDAYYSGYFQCEKYFKEIEDTIRNDFQFKPISDINLKAKRAEIKSLECPIFVNVRRGDYVELDKNNKVHWLCSNSYYKQATDFMAKKYPNCSFIAISDEPDWVKDNLNIAHPFKVYSSETDYLDIYLLQACKHAICANSSYSWWGAWLIDNPNKTIIAPYPWFDFESDIIPDNWITFSRV